jgi:hypothetical protein
MVSAQNDIYQMLRRRIIGTASSTIPRDDAEADNENFDGKTTQWRVDWVSG